MARRKLDLAETIRTALAKPEAASLSEALEPWDDKELTLGDAEGLVSALAAITDVKPLIDAKVHGETGTPLQTLAVLFQNESSDDATRLLRDRGMTELMRLFDAAIMVPECPSDPILTICKMFAVYVSKPGLERIVAAVRRFPDEYMWEIVFGVFADEGHPLSTELIDRLRDPLPTDFAAVAYLDLVNAAAREKRLDAHPFDTEEGHKRLETWLADSNSEHFSYAHSAAAALPFIESKARNSLASLAMDHSDTGVQMEAAWASAYRGGTAGLTVLARMCEDPHHSIMAQQYLEELEQSDRIPAAAREPDFNALAQMCQWLRHPNEFGEPPTEVTLFDTRELDWPPTNDRRRVWLFKYTYAGRNEDGTDEVGLGMVGSITFALFGETNAAMSPEDAYAIHCCWELDVNDDPRAPKKRTVKAGRKLLGI
ncbi:hypothetical protein VT84_21915 [Gemmata sp. SH-PL17]|uniref:hypothetical protein n=1 Tax=Gemmata sp. SH-PL17 TaxID=1630693 RepID=UPI00078E524C|nr:hypothetical protein [Gemmata sp. SH-PL17]AMV27074.1 hypothetical protein VT84_21915 [Gemmata sp. SH-PL17]